jgi:hypothetical protein
MRGTLRALSRRLSELERRQPPPTERRRDVHIEARRGGGWEIRYDPDRPYHAALFVPWEFRSDPEAGLNDAQKRFLRPDDRKAIYCHWPAPDAEGFEAEGEAGAGAAAGGFRP